MTKFTQRDSGNLPAAGVSLTTWQSDAHTAEWLRIRNLVFKSTSGGGRDWTTADFEREFLAKASWNGDWMWFARQSSGEAVGSVHLARSTEDASIGYLQWLMVVPSWRRRGVATVLVSAMERVAWQAEIRQLKLETLGAWEEAVTFYRARGWQ